MDVSLLLTILSSLIFLVFFVLYNRNILSGSIRPNIVTWSLFSLITLINTLTYFSFTSDIMKSALAATDCFTCIVITALIVFKGRYSKIRKLEISIILISIASIIFWYKFHSATYANLLLQPAYILAFVPTLRNAWENPQDESALVWFAWALSFVLTLVVITIRWSNNLADIINPLIALILHSLVGSFALRKKA